MIESNFQLQNMFKSSTEFRLAFGLQEAVYALFFSCTSRRYDPKITPISCSCPFFKLKNSNSPVFLGQYYHYLARMTSNVYTNVILVLMIFSN